MVRHISLLVLALWLLTTLAACSAGEPTATPTVRRVLYTNERIGFSISYPQGWQVEPTEAGIELVGPNGKLLVNGADPDGLPLPTFANMMLVETGNRIRGSGGTSEVLEMTRVVDGQTHYMVAGMKVVDADGTRRLGGFRFYPTTADGVIVVNWLVSEELDASFEQTLDTTLATFALLRP